VTRTYPSRQANTVPLASRVASAAGRLGSNGGVGGWQGTGATRLNVWTADDDQGEKGMEPELHWLFFVSSIDEENGLAYLY